MTERPKPDWWERDRTKDKRFMYGDDYAGDAWRNLRTDEVKWVAVGQGP